MLEIIIAFLGVGIVSALLAIGVELTQIRKIHLEILHAVQYLGKGE